MRVILFLAMMAPLAACTAVNPDPLLTASVAPSAPPIASEVSPDFAAAFLPASAGRIRTVRQIIGKDSLEQTVVYEGPSSMPGENKIEVKVAKTGAGKGFHRAPTRAEIAAEMRRELPGIALSIRPEISENAYGVYGLATGHFGASGACLYAWQSIPGENGSYPAKVRVHVCHENMSEEAIGSLMHGLRLKPVSAETLAVLRFAGGSGQMALPVAPSPSLAAEPAKPPVARKKVVRHVDESADLGAVVLPIVRRGAAAQVAGVAPQPTKGAVIPLPGEPQATSAARGQVSAVPLPEQAMAN